MARRSTKALRAAPESRFALPRRGLGVLDEEERELVRGHVQALLERPTAPYAEDLQVAVLRDFAERHAGFELRLDRDANLLLTWKGKRGKRGSARSRGKKNAPTLAFSAHLDHPGFLYAGMRSGLRTATFHGGVPERYFRGSPVRFFDPVSGEACATARIAKIGRNREKLIRAELSDFRGVARRGMFGMWDLTPGRLRGRRFHGRVCDDLLGAAALLATLEILARRGHRERVIGIFTRAEETGFIGCQGLLRSRALGRKVAVVGLECSPKRSTAKVGKGPVIRVGDAATIFEPEITHHFQAAAAELGRRHEDFRFQRALMDGGRCESSAYNLWGVPAGGLCLALGNYHNCSPSGEIAPEYVDWHDLEGMVALMLEGAEQWSSPAAKSKMRTALDRIWDRESERLRVSAERISAL